MSPRRDAVILPLHRHPLAVQRHLCGGGVLPAPSNPEPGDALKSRTQKHRYSNTWTPKVCKIMAFWAMFRSFGPLFHILLGSRYSSGVDSRPLRWIYPESQHLIIMYFQSILGYFGARVANHFELLGFR